MTASRPYVLRCVATAQTGMGHAVRILSLARHLPDASLAADPQTAARLRTLAPDLPLVEIDAHQTGSGAWVGAFDRPPHVILDTQYSGNSAATAVEVEALKRAGCAVTVIDSMPPDHFVARPGGAPDILVTPYIGADRLRPDPKIPLWLHGPRFAILSPAIVAARDLSRFPQEPRILVVCGGSDPSGLSAQIAARLRDVPAPVDLVVGPMFAGALRSRLDALARDHGGLRLHDAPGKLVDLYLSATLVVGRAGLTRYEAACLGRNGIYLSEGSAYAEYFDGFTRSGVAEIYTGTEATGAAAFLDRLEGLSDPARLAAVSRPNLRAYDTVDGMGAQRVAEAIRRGETEERE